MLLYIILNKFHMILSFFPSLLSYQLFAPFALRLVLGIILILWAYKKFGNQKVYAIVEGTVGILLIIGLYTQLAVLIVSIGLITLIIKKIKVKAFLTDGVNYYLILLVIALSLLVTGPGRFAFDLPL
jgi:uncharacterized membrane protein YphA (DoxX/SURF4 family)